MSEIHTSTSTRLHFWDNLRFTVILGVIAFHAALSFIPGYTWWVNDTKTIAFMGIAVSILDVFMMPLLFVVAGFFTIPSLQRYGFKGFIKKKLLRLGIPFLAGSYLLNPIASYIFYAGRVDTSGGHAAGTGIFLLKYMKSSLEPSAGMLDIAQRASKGLFVQQHLWFLSLLLLFFIAAALFIKVSGRGKPATGGQEPSGSRNKVIILLCLLVLTFSLHAVFNSTAAQNRLFGDSPWFMLTPLFIFQVSRLPFYLLYFILGIIMSQRKWFQGKGIPGKSWLWFILMAVSLFLFMGSMEQYYVKHLRSTALSLYNALTHALLCLSACIFFISLFFKRWNSSSSFSRTMSANSYNMYIIHYPLVILAQYILKDATVNAYLKYPAVFLIALGCSYIISRFVIKPDRFSFS